MRVSNIADAKPGGRVLVALGAFDGVNRLHRAFLEELRRRADERSAELGLILIDGGVHHRARMLTSLSHRLELIGESGLVDAVWIVSSDIYLHPAEVIADALDRVAPAGLGLTTGFNLGVKDFATSELRALAEMRGIELLFLDHVLPGRDDSAERLFLAGSISELLSVGKVSIAAHLLGRPFEIRGLVEVGDQRGRTIGFPTANLSLPQELLLPEEGVYAGVAVVDDGRERAAAISLGRRATFYEAGWVLLEAHLLDFDDDIYGRSLRVLFTEHLRPQRHFAGVDDLVAQLRIDVALVKELQPLERLGPTAFGGT